MVLARSREGGVDLGSLEVRQRHHGAAPYRGLVLKRADDGCERIVVPNSPESHDRRFTTTRVVVVNGDVDQPCEARGVASFAEREGRALDDERVGVTEQVDHGWEHVVAATLGDRDEGFALDCTVVVGEAPAPCRGVE